MMNYNNFKGLYVLYVAKRQEKFQVVLNVITQFAKIAEVVLINAHTVDYVIVRIAITKKKQQTQQQQIQNTNQKRQQMQQTQNKQQTAAAEEWSNDYDTDFGHDQGGGSDYD